MVVNIDQQRDRVGMLDLEFEIKLLRGASSRLNAKEEALIKAFFEDPTDESWTDASNVCVQVVTSVDDPRPLSLGAAVVRHIPEATALVRRARVGGKQQLLWSEIPTPEVVHAAMSAITRTNRMAPINLELELARTAENRLTFDERVDIYRAYYGGLATDFLTAKDIVLLEEGDLDGSDLTLLKAIDHTDPEWLPQHLLEKHENGRPVKTISCAPPAELFRTALIRATH